MENIVLKHGMIYDGTGNAPFLGDIWIVGDKIKEVGECLKAEPCSKVIELEGLAVTPGFIDMHRHCDKSPFVMQEAGKDGGRGQAGQNRQDGQAVEDVKGGQDVQDVKGEQRDYGSVLLRQGITTVVTGHCGISMYPLSDDPEIIRQMWDYYAPVLGRLDSFSSITSYAEYKKRLWGCKLPVNTGTMLGMGAIRIAVKGFSSEPLRREEREQCRRMVKEALEQGALGVSIGLMYLPECYGTAEELGEILQPLKQYDGILTTHIRGEGDSLVKSVEEVIAIGRLAGCRVEISHFKSCGVKNWNREIYRAIEKIEEARKEGMDICCDFYPYDCGSTTLMSMIPPAFTDGNIPLALNRLLTGEGQEELREMLKQTYEDWDNYALSLGWDKVILSSAECRENQGKIGKSIADIANEFGYQDEVEAAAHILTSEHGTAAAIIQSMHQPDIDAVARLPYSSLISDAIYAETDRPHPRMYGAFPRLIADYVKKRGVLSLEEAIRKMTLLPAKQMGIRSRGRIQEGYFADINVFDPDKFQDRATYTHPTQYAQNLSYCFVNGRLALCHDQVVGKENGVVL